MEAVHLLLEATACEALPRMSVQGDAALWPQEMQDAHDCRERLAQQQGIGDDHRRWLAGDAMTLADFAAAAHLSALDYISDVDWNRSEVVKDWYAKIKSRPAFRSILADQVPGFPPPRHYNDLDF